ncbi:MAG: metalloregulator ArsR/SmtB family transcription factor [Eubacteriales bacterium]|nr:metalloregulator ArsR/SmtB family transcription factor [Eubacteriales bacterium]
MEKHAEYALLFKALSDETRLKIVEMLSCGELCACDILESFEITQPTLSYHMKILTDCGLISSRKDGSWIRYSSNIEKVNAIKSFWEHITTEQQDCICKNSSKTECD